MKYFNLFLLSLFIYFFSEISCLSRSLYFGKQKCFYDHYYSQMNIVLTYKILDTDIKMSDMNKNIFFISIHGMEKMTFKSFYGTKLSGKFSYNIEESDKYKICISTSDKELFKYKKYLHLEFKIQSSDELYDAHSAKAKDFQKVNFTMQKIDSKVKAIEIMQNYENDIEDKFSRNQIKSSTRLAFISACQIIIICIVGIYHVFSLRKIFKDKIWAPF